MILQNFIFWLEGGMGAIALEVQREDAFITEIYWLARTGESGWGGQHP